MLILPHSHPAVRKLLAAWQRHTAPGPANVTAACKPSSSCRGWCVDALRLGRADTTRSGKHLRIRLCEGPRRPIRSARPASRDPPHLRLSRLQQLVSSGGLVRSLAGCDNDAPKPALSMLMLHRHVCTPLLCTPVSRPSATPCLLLLCLLDATALPALPTSPAPGTACMAPLQRVPAPRRAFRETRAGSHPRDEICGLRCSPSRGERDEDVRLSEMRAV